MPGDLTSLPPDLQPADSDSIAPGVTVGLADGDATGWPYTARSGRAMMATLENGAGFTASACDESGTVVRWCSVTSGPGTLRMFGTRQS